MIGEIKEGRAELNKGARKATLASWNQVRLVAFGTAPPDVARPGYQVILLHQITKFLDDYIRQYWKILKHGQFKDHGLGFLVTLEKVRRAAQ